MKLNSQASTAKKFSQQKLWHSSFQEISASVKNGHTAWFQRTGSEREEQCSKENELHHLRMARRSEQLAKIENPHSRIIELP